MLRSSNEKLNDADSPPSGPRFRDLLARVLRWVAILDTPMGQRSVGSEHAQGVNARGATGWEERGEGSGGA
jgi:hypothetical protein